MRILSGAEAVQQRQGLAGEQIGGLVPDAGAAASLEIGIAAERDESEDLLEQRLVARDRERSGVIGEAVLLLRQAEEAPEDRVVEERRAHHESPAAAPDGDRHVPRRHVRRQAVAGGGRRRLLPPRPQHLADPHDLSDFVALRHGCAAALLAVCMSFELESRRKVMGSY